MNIHSYDKFIIVRHIFHPLKRLLRLLSELNSLLHGTHQQVIGARDSHRILTTVNPRFVHHMSSVVDMPFNSLLQLIYLFRSIMIVRSAVTVIALQILQLTEVFLLCLLYLLKGTSCIFRNTPLIFRIHIFHILLVGVARIAV